MMPAVEKLGDWSRDQYVLVDHGAFKHTFALGKDTRTVSDVKEV